MTIGEKVIGRVLVCTVCSRSVDVIEAAMGAHTDNDHRHLEADTYRCGECMEKAGATVPTLEGATAQERADAQVEWARRTGDAIPYQPAVMA